MSKYDEQLERMSFLMEYKNEPKKAISNIEYHANGADGKVYGILKEGTKYYIKTTEMGKENIAESYDYINGFVNRRENEYKSYNEATKHLELKLMSLNEAYGKKSDVSTVDFKRGEKTLSYLTEEARKELDRMNQIIENCEKIGPNCVCDPESKGKSTAEQTEKNNKPFDDKVTADMDFSGSKGSVEGASDGKKVSGVEEDLQSDKMKKGNSNLDGEGNDKNNKDAHDDLDGESVADKNPSGGKVVKVNEGLFEVGPNDEEVVGPADAAMTEPSIDPLDDPNFQGGEPEMNTEPDVIDAEEGEVDPDGTPLDASPEIVGSPEDDLEECDLEEMLEEFLNEEDLVAGDNKVMTHQGNPINGTNNGVDGETSEDWKRIEEEEGYGETDKSEETETMDNYKFGYNKEKKLPVQSWDKMNLSESQKKVVKKLTESIYNKIVGKSKKKETLQEAIDRIVKEEVTKLNVWGKHPKFGKEPMTHPDAKEVLAGTADRDFNDDSAKGSERYGKKIGVGKPFDQDVVDLLTDQVLAKIKSEAYK